MKAESIIDVTIPGVTKAYTCNRVLSLMETFKISHLPVLDGDVYLGLVSEDEIYDREMFSEPVESVGTLKCPCVLENQHVFDVLAVMTKFSIPVVPVVSSERKYIGAVSMKNLLDAISKIVNVEAMGAILVLEMGVHDYSMSQIAQIVESENARILSLHVAAIEDSSRINVTLVINKVEMTPVVRSLERYGYRVDTFFCENNMIDDFYRNRYEFLMNYMKI